MLATPCPTAANQLAPSTCTSTCAAALLRQFVNSRPHLFCIIREHVEAAECAPAVLRYKRDLLQASFWPVVLFEALDVIWPSPALFAAATALLARPALMHASGD